MSTNPFYKYQNNNTVQSCNEKSRSRSKLLGSNNFNLCDVALSWGHSIPRDQKRDKNPKQAVKVKERYVSYIKDKLQFETMVWDLNDDDRFCTERVVLCFITYSFLEGFGPGSFWKPSCLSHVCFVLIALNLNLYNLYNIMKYILNI